MKEHIKEVPRECPDEELALQVGMTTFLTLSDNFNNTMNGLLDS